jgi:uncharacterized protein (DUF2141 family)
MHLLRTLFSSTLFGAVALQCAFAEQADASVRIEVSGLRGTRGDVGCLLFGTADGYPEIHAKAYREIPAPIERAGTVCMFKDVAPGTYAAIVFHDENINGKLDKNFVDMPQEGYGASNNVRPRFSAPGFVEASFVVAAGAVTPIHIQMGYSAWTP